MAIYKHKETGAVVVTDSELKGNWEIIKEPKTKTKAKE